MTTATTPKEHVHQMVTLKLVDVPSGLIATVREQIASAATDMRGVYWCEFKGGHAPKGHCSLCGQPVGGPRRTWVSAIGEVLCSEGVHIVKR